VESLAGARRAKAKLKAGAAPDKPARDLMLDESLAVINDMVDLRNGILKPAAAVPATAVVRNDPKPL